MHEKGIDISRNKPKHTTMQMVKEADSVIVMWCSAEGFCRAPLLKKVTDWNIEDPKGKTAETLGMMRDEMETKVIRLVAEIGD